MRQTTAEVIEAPALAVVDKRAQVETLLTDILAQMDFPARLEFKDLEDGSLGVAVHFEGEPPGTAPGKKSYLIESLQFLLNKAVNRPNVERRWISVGLGGFPPPRQQKPNREAAPPPATAVPAAKGTPAASPAAARVSAPAPDAAPAGATARGSAPRGQPQEQGRRDRGQPRGIERAPQKQGEKPRRAEAEEASVEVPEDAQVTAFARALAQKAATKGRSYAVLRLSTEDRARVLKAVAGLPGVRVKVEGDGYFRRVAFVPEKPVPMPKKAVMPDYDDDEE